MSALLLVKIILIGLAMLLLLLLASWIELYSQIGRYKTYWDKRNSQTAQPGEILYVALGDSTAQGIGASSPDRGYVGLLAKQLEESKNRPVRVVNLSKSGAKAKDVLEVQLPALEKLNSGPETVVTISIGANDMSSFNPSTFEKEMDKIMGRLPRQAAISDIPYFGDGRHKALGPKVLAANKIMYKLAEKHEFKLVPLHERIQKNGGLKTVAADFFHPSNTSYRENWKPVFLERIL